MASSAVIDELRKPQINTITPSSDPVIAKHIDVFPRYLTEGAAVAVPFRDLIQAATHRLQREISVHYSQVVVVFLRSSIFVLMEPRIG